jgi:hypothetical protein
MSANFHSSPNIIITIKSRRMAWVGHVACIGEKRGSRKFPAEKLEKTNRKT